MVRLVFVVSFIAVFFFTVSGQGCNMSNFTSVTTLTASSYPFTSPGSGITVNAAASGVPTLSNTSYACNGTTFATTSPAWWLNASNQTITLTFSVPVTKFTVVVNGTNTTEVFNFNSNTGTNTLSDYCTAGFAVLPSLNQLIYNGSPSTGTIISVNNSPGATQFYLTHNGLGSGSRIALLDCFVPGVLPVTLVSFTGENVPDMQVNRLNWSTSEEMNAAGFDIEHSMDGTEWSTLGFVQAAGAPSYTYVHPNPEAGTHFYKLKMKDLDGNYTYSEVREVVVEQQMGMAVYPNPSSDGLFHVVSSSKQADLFVLDILGREVYSSKFESGKTLDLSGLPQGAYILVMQTQSGQKFSERISIF